MTSSTADSDDPRPAGMPGDRGLPGLGLMMQLWSGIDVITHVAFLLFWLRLPTRGTGVVLGLLAAGLVRAATHYVVGVEIRAGGMKIPSRVRALLVVSVLHVLVLAWVGMPEVTGMGLLLAADTLVWPVFLVVMLHRPVWRSRFARVSEGELELRDPNRGIEAAGAMMVVLGTSGTILTGAVLMAFLEGPIDLARRYPETDLWILVGAGVLLLRGLFHVYIGIKAMRGASPSTFHRDVGHYMRVSVVATLVAVAPLLYAVMKNVDFMGTLALTMVLLLLVWPLVLRGFAAQVAGDHGELDEPAQAARAPDGGLVTAGWLLCAIASASLVQAAVTLLEGPVSWAGVGMLHGPGWYFDPSLPVWLGAVGVAVTLWAGLEMIAYTSRARIAALVFAVITIAVSLWARMDALPRVGEGMGEALMRLETVFTRADLLMSLLVPMMVAVLALRPRPADDRSSSGVAEA